MKKRTCALFLALCLLCSFIVPASAEETGPVSEEAVYLGVESYGTVTSADKATFDHNFSVNGETKTYKVANDGSTYAIENTLQEGYIYDITVEDGKVTAATMLDRGNDSVVMGKVNAVDGSSITVGETALTMDGSTKTWKITSQAGGSEVAPDTVAVGDSVKVVKDGGAAKSIYITFVAEDYAAPVSGEPGVKTLKNFLATAMEPVGTALYVYGGTWDWQDVNSSNQAMTIGLSQSWVDFFQSQDANYSYKNNADHAHSYYPHEAWNQYYYAGIDCSGYVGWAVYNVMNTESATVSESDGYVQGATGMAGAFKDKGWGTMDMGKVLLNPDGSEWKDDDGDGRRVFDDSEFKVGDIFSMNGHVWICLGTCDDGSIVFLHSTPSDSKAGKSGGGVQISAIGPNENCEAYQLASFYMKAFYPKWSERYDAVLKSFNGYTRVYYNTAGKFSWDLTGAGLTDPEGYASKKPAEILKDLFGGNAVRFESNGGSAVETQSVTGGATAAKPANPTRSNYRFDGWYADSTLKTPYDFTKPVTENITLYAKWTYMSSGGGGGGSTAATTYTVTASAGNGGTISPSGKVSVNRGNSKTFTITANEGYRIADVLVNGKSVGAVGSYTIKNITANQTITASFAKQDGSVPFNDVPENAWYLDGVEYAYENGLLKGTTDTTFSPNATLTRGMLVTVLYRMAGSPAVTGQCPFADVAKGSYCEEAVTWAVANGVVNGFTATTFAPNQNVTREQMAAILYRYADLKGYDVSAAADLSAFTDAGSIAAYAVPAVKWANAAGLVQGTTATTINPKGNATRAQVSMILMRFAENVAK